MASRDVYDLLILHGPDAKEWCQYLFSLFQTHPEGRDFAIDSYELNENEPIQRKNLKTFQNSKCILMLLSGDLESNFDNPDVLQSLRTVLRPPHKIIVLFCGVMDKEDFTYIFQDWPHWKQLSSEDEPELYVIRVKDTILDDSGCESGTEPEHPQDQSHPEAIQGNLLSIQPERIRCGVKTEIYLIFKCKLDSGIKNEVNFNPLNGPCVRSPATLQNEYILSVDAPDLPSGPVFLKVFSGDLPICDAKITYFTDMEEICQLLDSATNPVEFMCQAFKIIPYNREALDKLLTESLKNNIPASGLHLFGINQIEEENTIANQRDEELPTLLHFSAKYGLKNLTALLLTCPGALQAYSVSNKHGDFPNNIAEKYGFRDLRQFIDEYVETADMLKTHIKEELMQGDNDDSLYETMVNLSTDILMKCSLHPGSEEDLYETMVGFADETYIDMSQLEIHDPSLETQGLTAQDSMLRKILEGSSLGINDKEYGNDMKNPYQQCINEDYDIVGSATSSSTALTCRPPIPIPRPENPPETEPFISQVFGRKMPVPRNENIYMESFRSRTASSVKLKRDRQQSSVYDPFAGMKTPGQRELITLQERVKLGMISVDEAVLEFKEWQLNQKRRSDSFRYQQENLRRLRDSINRRRDENKKTKNSDIEITRPIPRGKNRRAVQDYGIYEQASSLVPSQVEISRGNWKTDSTSSTASSNSNRSSTRSTLSLSSGREGDNEEELPDELTEDRPRYSPRHASLQEERPPPRPPRIQNHSTRRSRMSSSGHSCRAPPVPPRGNN
ncbi:phosphoinositide 3-kinase adapter protein 1 isoform X2 [Rana temporaria]|uniref:phosphoinositide 3-kinase adapter protein 1 isoform X2 n=1 Tax=Rana temporaria TaxID=8407 RepID=UPI001AACBBB2|nr:phosphoinositide 3-kinase adapter protein 1 isoform X2 [Rana temporaria]